jgi:hypothetical protein
LREVALNSSIPARVIDSLRIGEEFDACTWPMIARPQRRIERELICCVFPARPVRQIRKSGGDSGCNVRLPDLACADTFV